MTIPFTQYIRPDGRPMPTEISMPKDVEDKAHYLIEHGYVFESEILLNGMISLTCTNDYDFGSHELCKNGPEVTEAVKELVEIAYLMEKKEKKHRG